MVNPRYKKWLLVAEKIREEVPDKRNVSCPNCSRFNIGYEFIGDERNKVGYFLVWCNDCLEGVHISRIEIPEQAKVIPFDASLERILHIPNFKKISP